MKRSVLTLRRYIELLPRYLKDKNGEVYTLTFQPSAKVDSDSKMTEIWIAGYMRVTDEINWIYRNTGNTLYTAVKNLKLELSKKR